VGDIKMRDAYLKTPKKSIVTEEVSKMSKKSKMSKNNDIGTNREREECCSSFTGVSLDNVPKKIMMPQY
jgi:hypothetical protein